MEVESAYRRTLISVAWHGEPKGLHFRITNNDVEVVTTFKLILTDLKWWSPDRHVFVMVREFHAHGSFIAVELKPRTRQLFHKDHTVAEFLHFKDDNAVWFLGKTRPSEPSVRQQFSREGIWEVTLRHELDGKPVIHNEVRCF